MTVTANLLPDYRSWLNYSDVSDEAFTHDESGRLIIDDLDARIKFYGRYIDGEPDILYMDGESFDVLGMDEENVTLHNGRGAFEIPRWQYDADFVLSPDWA